MMPKWGTDLDPRVIRNNDRKLLDPDVDVTLYDVLTAAPWGRDQEQDWRPVLAEEKRREAAARLYRAEWIAKKNRT
jgi:hypothetical protein